MPGENRTQKSKADGQDVNRRTTSNNNVTSQSKNKSSTSSNANGSTSHGNRSKSSSSSKSAHDQDVEENTEDDDNDSFSEVQDPRERRDIRHRYRNLGEDLQQKQHDLTNPENTELQQMLNKVNNIYQDVKMTREAAMDASVVSMISSLARQQAQSLHAEFIVFQPSEFAEKLVSYVSGSQLPEGQRSEITAEGWQSLGEAVQPFFKRSPPLHIMFGSFEREKPVRKDVKTKQRAKDKDALQDKQTVPTQLKSLNETERNEATTEEVDRIYGILSQYYEDWNRQPICYFEFVMNPDSFGQSIENIFYTSFLVRDKLARIFLDADKLPVIEPIENNSQQAESDEMTKRHQVILTLNIEQWREIIRKFQIKEPLIPTRDKLSKAERSSAASGSQDERKKRKK